MKIETDHYFWIGKTHKINQDYCLSGSINGYHYAIVCDGCSSSPDSDFGARILARAAVNNISIFNSRDFKTAVISSARIQAVSLGLPLDSLNATLVMAVADPEGSVSAQCFGDGSIVILFEDRWEAFTFSFISGAPLYLNYLLGNRIEQYLKEFEFRPFVYNKTSTGAESGICINKETIINDCGFCLSYLDSKAYLFTDNIKGIFVCSDGLDSFFKSEITDSSKTTSKIKYKDVCDELFNFKSRHGEFITRRAKKFQRFCEKNQWTNADDCSIAGMCFTKD